MKNQFPFEVPFEDIAAAPDKYISSVFSCLESEFLVMPKGAGFVDYPIFEHGYEALKKATSGFTKFDIEAELEAIRTTPIALIVMRTMLGFTPPEWAYLATRKGPVAISQGFIRTLDRKIRLGSGGKLEFQGATKEKVRILIQTANQLLTDGAAKVEKDKLHRLEKVDTKNGAQTLPNIAALGVPYAMLLYERFLGRPFAGHRDSVSELVGDGLEDRIEEVLTAASISFRKTKRAEKLDGFDQAPDFIIPSEFNPQVVIEAKLTEDDGTARDKVTRIQHLGELSTKGQKPGKSGFEVIACIGGRGFGVRREDMRKMLEATRGKVFTLKTLDKIVECTRLKEFRSR